MRSDNMINEHVCGEPVCGGLSGEQRVGVRQSVWLIDDVIHGARACWFQLCAATGACTHLVWCVGRCGQVYSVVALQIAMVSYL
jgi:hypothetical protein